MPWISPVHVHAPTKTLPTTATLAQRSQHHRPSPVPTLTVLTCRGERRVPRHAASDDHPTTGATRRVIRESRRPSAAGNPFQQGHRRSRRSAPTRLASVRPLHRSHGPEPATPSTDSDPPERRTTDGPAPRCRPVSIPRISPAARPPPCDGDSSACAIPTSRCQGRRRRSSRAQARPRTSW